MADEGRIVGYSIFGFFVGLWLFYKGFKSYRLKRMIENIPTSKIRSLAMGLVEIYGRVLPAEKKIFKSPLTGKDCVYYHYTIEELRSSGKSSRWVTIKEDAQGVPFFLEDETGRVLVDSAGAEFGMSADFEYSSSIFKKPPQQVSDFLTASRIARSFFGLKKSMRFKEWIIAPDDKLYIMGTADDNPFVEEGSARQNAEDIMIRKGKHEKTYYISDKDEKSTLSSISWKAYGMVFGGGALSAACLTVIFLYLGIF